MTSKPKQVSESTEHSDDEQQSDSLSNDLVVTKYATAADIVNFALKEIIKEVKSGVEVGFLCDLGNKIIEDRVSKIFKKEKELQKGIAMPTCISVDNCICHYSPLRSDPPVCLKDGQMVKIDLGAHVDGFVANVAHTVVVGATHDNKVVGNKANVMLASYHAMEVVLRMLRPGLYKNFQITDMIDRIAAVYSVKPIENVLSHQLEKNKIDGGKEIIQNPGEKQKELPKCTFEKHEAYAIDIMMSTGDGRARPQDARTTVYKKAEDIYSLKMKTARIFYSQATNKYGSMPFTLRSFEDEKQAKLGVVECERHGLLRPYQVLYERDGEYVAQFKCTALIMPNGILKITGLPLDMDLIESDVKIIDPEINALLTASLKPKKKKNGGEKKADDKSAISNEENETKINTNKQLNTPNAGKDKGEKSSIADHANNKTAKKKNENEKKEDMKEVVRREERAK